MNNEQHCGTTPILQSEPIDIPNVKKCRENHGLVTAVPREDITFGVFRRKLGYKLRVKSLEKQKREIEKRNCEVEKARIASLEKQLQDEH